MQLQCEATQQAYAQLMCVHQALGEQHEQLQQQHASLLAQCRVVREVCKQVDGALALDPQLQQQVQQWQAQNVMQLQEGVGCTQAQQEQQQPEVQQQVASLPVVQQQPPQQQQNQHQQQQQPLPKQLDSSQQPDPDTAASDLQDLAQRLDQQVQAMYASWRSAVNARDVAQTQRFQMADQLREAEEGAYLMQREHSALQQVLAEVQQQLQGSQVSVCMCVNVSVCKCLLVAWTPTACMLSQHHGSYPHTPTHTQ
jgi:hypothetical protein